MAPRGDGSIYETADGRWHASLTIAGRRVHRSGRTRADVVSKLRRLRGEAAAGEVTSGRWPTVQQWITYYLTEVAPTTGKTTQGTLDQYRSTAETWIYPRIGDVRINVLTVAQARDTIYAPLAAGRSGSSARHVHAVLRRALRVAMAERNLTRNVASLVDRPPYDPEPIDPPTRRDARRLLDVAATLPRNGARWAFALGLGVRQGEALGLPWDCVDLDEQTVEIRWSLKSVRGEHGCGVHRIVVRDGKRRKVWPCGKAQGARCPKRTREAGLHLKAPKSRSGVRTISLPPEIVGLLRKHRQAQLEERLAAPGWTPWTTTPIGEKHARRVELVFAQPNGRPINPRDDHEDWKQLLADANVPEARLHDARHTAATVLLEMGVDVKVVSALLGHSTVALTQNQYQHLVPELRRDAADAMSGALWGADELGTARKRRRRA